MPELTEHEFLFGNKLVYTVEWIVSEAIKKNTVEAYDFAIAQLRGIDRFMNVLDLHITALRISNTSRKLSALRDMISDDPDLVVGAIAKYHGALPDGIDILDALTN